MLLQKFRIIIVLRLRLPRLQNALEHTLQGWVRSVWQLDVMQKEVGWCLV